MTTFSALVRLLGEASASLLAPNTCAACDATVPMRTIFCAACASTLEVAPRDAIAPFVYGGAIARAITRFKYENRPDLARPLGEILRYGFRARPASTSDVVCPVPLHPSRLASRGFNQAALLAHPLAKDLATRFAPRALARVRDTAQQAMLERGERAKNVAGAFRVGPRVDVRGLRVLVVDDVRTTGATLAACEVALRQAGARDVAHAVLAVAASS